MGYKIELITSAIADQMLAVRYLAVWRAVLAVHLLSNSCSPLTPEANLVSAVGDRSEPGVSLQQTESVRMALSNKVTHNNHLLAF